MIYFDLLSDIKKSEERVILIEEQRKAFHLKLSIELCNMVFNYFPKLKHPGKKYYLQLYEISNSCASESLKIIDLIFTIDKPDQPDIDNNKPLQPIIREESKKNSQEQLKAHVPHFHHSMFDNHLEMLDKNQISEIFRNKIHNKIKEEIIEFYATEFINLDSVHRWMLDGNIAFYCANPFIKSLCELESDLKDS